MKAEDKVNVLEDNQIVSRIVTPTEIKLMKKMTVRELRGNKWCWVDYYYKLSQ